MINNVFFMLTCARVKRRKEQQVIEWLTAGMGISIKDKNKGLYFCEYQSFEFRISTFEGVRIKGLSFDYSAF